MIRCVFDTNALLKILELAVSGNAEYIVTGDADLLTLNPFRGIAIIAPAEFLRVNRP